MNSNHLQSSTTAPPCSHQYHSNDEDVLFREGGNPRRHNTTTATRTSRTINSPSQQLHNYSTKTYNRRTTLSTIHPSQQHLLHYNPSQSRHCPRRNTRCVTVHNSRFTTVEKGRSILLLFHSRDSFEELSIGLFGRREWRGGGGWVGGGEEVK